MPCHVICWQHQRRRGSIFWLVGRVSGVWWTRSAALARLSPGLLWAVALFALLGLVFPLRGSAQLADDPTTDRAMIGSTPQLTYGYLRDKYGERESLGSLALPSVRLGSGNSSCDDTERPYAIVLGIAQDAGAPQIGCQKECCRDRWGDVRLQEDVSSIAVVDPLTRERWLFDCTPSFPRQLQLLDEQTGETETGPLLNGIFLTHAHIGHYTGLMHLGREAMGARRVPVFAMPRMAAFLESNGPWSQLVELENIRVNRIAAGARVQLNDRIAVVPILVPHRDEFSETVGFQVIGPERSLLFIPDIDKWQRWDVNINQLVRDAEYALLDGTFFADGELPGRDIAEIPHPFITESMQQFAELNDEDRAKVRFIHLNHTNPALRPDSDATRQVQESGMDIARPLDKFPL